jgi:uncharacterized protein (TIRG00374 family)
VLRAWRWQYLFRAETRPPFGKVLAAMLLGQFFNNVLPARAGEAARIIYLNQTAGTSRAESTGTVVLERIYDVLSVLILLFVLVPWLPHVSWIRGAAILAVVLTVVLVAIFVIVALYQERPIRAALRPLARLPFLSVERLEAVAVNLVHGLVALRRPRLALVSMALTTLSWIVLGFAAWFVMRGFHLGLSPVAGILANITVALALILPSSPGAIGVFEAAVVLAAKAYGVSDAKAFSFALVVHIVNYLPYIAAGVLILQTHAFSFRRR